MFGFSTLMIHSKLLDNKKENNSLIFSKNLYKGACVKIKNSNKTFQVIGLNIGKETVSYTHLTLPTNDRV